MREKKDSSLMKLGLRRKSVHQENNQEKMVVSVMHSCDIGQGVKSANWIFFFKFVIAELGKSIFIYVVESRLKD